MTEQPTADASTFERIPKRQVFEEVARQIQLYIARRRLRAGERLPTERELAEQLGVSRGAVREGLRMLSGLEILDVRQGSGIFVRQPQRLVLIDPSLVDDKERLGLLKKATETRRVIDCAAVEAATRAASDEALKEIRTYLEQADQEPTRTKLAQSIDLTFEDMIGQSADNPYLSAIQREAHRYFRAVWEAQGFIPRPAQERSVQHWAILEAMERRDVAAARARMEDHFDLQALDLRSSGLPDRRLDRG